MAGVVDPSSWPYHDLVVEQAARFTLAFSLVEVAMRLPAGVVRDLRRPLAVLLGGVMPLSCAITGVLGWWLLDLPVWTAVLVGAVVAPTDPVAASAIVNGGVARDRVPEELRFTLTAESGMNDGLALALVILPIVVMTHGADALPSEWLGRVVLWEIGAAVAVGAAMGWAAGAAWNRAEGSESLDPPTILMYSLALALVILGTAHLIGSDDILAVFVGGLVFDRQISEEAKSEERIQKAVTRFFTTPIFVLLGAALPFGAWGRMGWAALAFAVLVLLLRRLPPLLILAPLVPQVRTLPEKLFLGWFGPIGVASIFYAFLAMRRLGDARIWEIASLVIAGSVVVHGLTATWATDRFPRDGE